MRVHMYDWLILAESQDRCHSHVQQLQQLASRLGFIIHFAKSFPFLGMIFNTKEFSVRPSDARLNRLSSLMGSLST